ncbi:MAG: oxygenase MpaB family protein [Sandaracinaceae bacterium]
MTVSSDALERSLARVEARVGSRRAGLYGPGSVSWEVNRESVTMLGGGCAALMQLAHPHVAYAVDQHSQTRADPVGRFARTFQHVFAMAFGDLDSALASARRVHALHRTIRGRVHEDVGRSRRGDRYEANDPSALLWVHATLVDTALRVYELTVTRLGRLEREAYYEESKLFAYLFGIEEPILPETWDDFERYYADTIESGLLAASEPARRMREFLFRPPTAAHAPLTAWFEVFTAGLLPERLREPFGFPFRARERAVFRASLPALRAAVRAAPPQLRFFPAYLDAMRRIRGRPGRDRIASWLESMALASLQPR